MLAGVGSSGSRNRKETETGHADQFVDADPSDRGGLGDPSWEASLGPAACWSHIGCLCSPAPLAAWQGTCPATKTACHKQLSPLECFGLIEQLSVAATALQAAKTTLDAAVAFAVRAVVRSH